MGTYGITRNKKNDGKRTFSKQVSHKRDTKRNRKTVTSKASM